MIRFAFYGAVGPKALFGTEEFRTSSLAKAQATCDRYGGAIVAEYFDIADREVSWPARPQAAALLTELHNPDHVFDAVIIPDLSNAIGGQRTPVLRWFTEANMPLWLGNIDAPYDPGDPVHRLTVEIFTGDDTKATGDA